MKSSKKLYLLAAACGVMAAINVGMYIWAGTLFSLIIAVFISASGIYALNTGAKVAAYEKEGWM